MDGTQIVRAEGGRELAVRLWGPEGGRPVFFLHGTLGGRLLRHTRGEYERHGLRVVTFDRPGFGRSTRQQGRTVADGAADVALVADRLGLDRAGVVGVSGGGPYALATAALFPDLVSRVAMIVAPAPVAAHGVDGFDVFDGLDEQDVRFLRGALEGGEQFLRADFPDVLAWLDELAAKPDGDDPGGHAQVVAAFQDALSPGPDGSVDDWLALLRPYGFDLSAVRAPARLMFARDDGGVPAGHVTWWREHLPQAEIEWVEGDHFGPRDEPEELLMAWAGGAAG